MRFTVKVCGVGCPSSPRQMDPTGSKSNALTSFTKSENVSFDLPTLGVSLNACWIVGLVPGENDHSNILYAGVCKFNTRSWINRVRQQSIKSILSYRIQIHNMDDSVSIQYYLTTSCNCFFNRELEVFGLTCAQIYWLILFAECWRLILQQREKYS